MKRREFVLAAGAMAGSRAQTPETSIRRGGQLLCAYRAEPGCHTLLLTHARRDSADTRKEPRAEVIGPAAEAAAFEQPGEFWSEFTSKRYHDYAALNSKAPVTPVQLARRVRPGERFAWQDLEFEVLDTPGWTPGAVSYLTELDGRRMAFTGDLVLAGGRLLDLHSLQDAIPELKLRAYHGYAARGGMLIRSLRQLAAREPSLLVPAHGVPITTPAEAIARLIGRLKDVFREHFTTDALRWYFGDGHWRRRAEALLEGEAPEPMQMAETQALPSWIRAIGNSRLLVSDAGEAFLLDCGYDRTIEALAALRGEGVFQRLAGIFVTHYHDDHTDRVRHCAERFGCQVHYERRCEDILLHPQRFYLPCLSRESIGRSQPHAHGEQFEWHEFRFTVMDHPGQTFFHSALLAERRGGGRVCFVGDSFTPSGMDDYCLRNRNLLGPDDGYFRCLRQLRSLPPDTWLINQHVEPMFRFTAEQLEKMEQSLAHRRDVLADLTPWPHANFAVDDQWIRLSPYECEASGAVRLAALVANHASSRMEFELRPHAPAGWQSKPAVIRGKLAPHRETAFEFTLTPPPRAKGVFVCTVSVRLAGLELPEYAECLVQLQPA
jgi:glyoxylase-like metal-dependent hydrolase (beta-lactamase superfamily II)